MDTRGRGTAYRPRVPREYTVDQARAALASLRPILDDVIAVRADLAELQAALSGGAGSTLGGLAELKAAQARLDELLSQLAASDVDVKGVAPLLLDFPGRLDGVDVLWCWVEGEPDIGWYHRADLGFLGRRGVPDAPDGPGGRR